MLAPGDPVPDLTLFGVDAEPVRILDLAPVLIAFYLYDWTGT
jgi:peroxiredoxin